MSKKIQVKRGLIVLGTVTTFALSLIGTNTINLPEMEVAPIYDLEDENMEVIDVVLDDPTQTPEDVRLDLNVDKEHFKVMENPHVVWNGEENEEHIKVKVPSDIAKEYKENNSVTDSNSQYKDEFEKDMLEEMPDFLK